MSANDTKTSKFLSLVLRHQPEQIGLTLDANGWALVSDLIERSKCASVYLTADGISEIVRASDKQRFALSDDGTKIRANQGHSLKVDRALEPKEPPEFLFHGTAGRFLEAIDLQGLKPMSRQHVHLSADEATARKVGQRHGKPVVLRIKSGEMHRAGRAFYLSANGVWLTDRVDTEFLEIPIA
jgi:putative RNA 2'-phosphotransferase